MTGEERCPAVVGGIARPGSTRCDLRAGHNSPHQAEGGCMTWEPRYVADMRNELRDAHDELECLRDLIRTAPHASHCEAGAPLFPGPCNCWKAKA